MSRSDAQNDPFVVKYRGVPPGGKSSAWRWECIDRYVSSGELGVGGGGKWMGERKEKRS